MTGINIDFFTVVLMVMLAFTWGYYAGKKTGREEIKKSINQAIKGIAEMLKSFDGSGKGLQDIQLSETDGNKNIRTFLEGLKKPADRHEEDQK